MKKAPSIPSFFVRGQTSVEFLFTVAGVLLAFLGISACFNAQMRGYLEGLFRFLRLPF